MEYNSRTKFTFGKYIGHELGIVFLYDPSYIEWCIDNTPMYVTDLQALQDNGVIRKTNWVLNRRSLSMVSSEELSYCKDYNECLKKVDLDKSFKFKQDVVVKNAEKLRLRGGIKIKLLKR